ncbi:MAG: hypothetical protein FJ405_09020 [Verrucomicrobia bacterium]|nr:hypothetical protein [Verrucomicrobiota bacterium]
MFRTLAGLTGACLFISTSLHAQTAVDDAAAEGMRRQAAKIELRTKLEKAQEAEKAGRSAEAARLYEECLQQLRNTGPTVEAEVAAVKAGMAASRLQVAQQAQRAGDMLEAERQVDRVLVVDPANAAAQQYKKNLEQIKAQLAGKMPSPEALAVIPESTAERVKLGTKVQDAKVLLEAGRIQEAEAKLKEVIAADPSNQQAYYYMNFIQEHKNNQELLKREGWARDTFAKVTQSWMDPNTRANLPQPNGYARTNSVNTSKARQNLFSKLGRITVSEIKFDNKTLADVVKDLSTEAQKRDPDRVGINFLVSPAAEQTAPPPPVIDPNTGQPIPQAAAPVEGAVNVGEVNIVMPNPIRNVSLAELLEAIVKTADRPIRYSVEDYAIIFSFRSRESEMLHTRVFKVDPNTFRQGLESVASASFASEVQGGTVGGSSGGGGAQGGRGGQGGGQGGQNGQAADQLGATFATVRVAALTQGGGGGGGAAGGIPSDPTSFRGEIGAGGGVTFLTRPSYTHVVQETVRNFFLAAGVNLDPPKQVFYNDRTGLLLVRAAIGDLDIIEQAIQVLNVPPPQLSIKARFAELNLNQSKALGFDWFLGNTLGLGGKIGGQAGTAPSYDGNPGVNAPGNPLGVFPYPDTLGFNRLPPSRTDGLLSSGLRPNITTPALGTMTGILTDPQFRVVIRALEQRGGVNILNAPEVVTVSARQTQIKVVDVNTIVTALDLQQTGAGGGGGGGGGVGGGAGAVGSTIQVVTSPFELGPVLDLVPYVSADGYTIQMTIIPTLKEFLGYDLESAQLFQAQAVSVGGAASPTIRQNVPLPSFRLRQVVTTAIVWDGQTVVLGGLISEREDKVKDKVPFLGDLPVFGRLFRSESYTSEKKNLMIFVTPTIIDPAGNRVHTDEEMPFAKSSIPAQAPAAGAPAVSGGANSTK